MYLITIRSPLNPQSKTAKKSKGMAGAYVNCWINFKNYASSEKLAKILIKEEGFIPEKKTDAYIMQRKHLKTKKLKQYYAEAIKYGYTLVLYLWPKNAPDANENYEVKKGTNKVILFFICLRPIFKTVSA
jgi:hypothetical protein